VKKITVRILLGLLAVAVARADTSLTINPTTPYGCLQNASIWNPPLTMDSSFSLTGVSGTGTLHSGINASAPSFGFPPEIYFFNYTIDLSALPAATNHCVKLLIHFGEPQGCDYDEVWGDPAAIQSATLAAFGDITFVFSGGCLSPGHAAVGFTMFSETAPKNGIVTVIDDYVDPASGTTNEAKINVPAIVPDIPPDPPWWTFYHPLNIPYVFFQGFLDTSTNEIPMTTNVSGPYDFTLQLLNAPSNGLAVSQVFTQTVQVVNGLFNMPLPFDPISMGDGSARWLKIGIRPPSPNAQFTPLNSPLPIAPAPQAFYAFTAGAVADLTPGQAVTSLNGLTDAVNLQAGSGIILGTNGNTLVISAQPGVPSDRNLKTDFAPIQPADILARVARLPITSWRYTNEVAGVRHVGPMAQDFKAAFDLGADGRMIGFVDENGVALAAIQGLNQKLDEKNLEIEQLKRQNELLANRLDELERTLKTVTNKQSPTKNENH
jgi:uncharacterized coiled-coil protein SlyX